MNLIAANLRHYYQRRGMWLVHLITGFYLFSSLVDPITRPRDEAGQFIGPLFLMLLFGLIAGVTALDVMVKPFSFCLPGHRRTMRGVLTITGLLCSGLISQVLWLHPDLTFLQHAAAVISAFFSCLIIYWAGIAVTLAVKNVGALIGLIVFAFFVGRVLGAHVVAERIIVSRPVIVCITGLAVTVWVWIWLGRREVVRRQCGKPWIGLFDAFNRAKAVKYAQANHERIDRLMRNASPWVEEVFIRLMDRSRGTARTVWACLYSALGPALGNWKRSAPFIAIIALTMGFMGQAAWFMLTFMPIMVLMNLRLPVYSTMLTVAGRRERFTCTLVNSLVVTVIAGILMLATVALLIPLSKIVPPIPIKENITLTLKPLDIRLCIIPLVILPLAMTIHVLFYRRPAVLILTAMLASYGAIFAMLAAQSHIMMYVNTATIFAVLIGGWMLYVLTLRYVCRRRCLVR